METTISTSRFGINTRELLNLTANLWFVTAVAGQWLFAYYIFVSYGGSAIEGNWAAWTNRMIHGFIEGDPVGNVAVLLHITLAFIITFSGPLQLIPKIRTNFPKFHHWNGRAYIGTAFAISVGAIYMTWSRDSTIGGVVGQLGVSLDGLLIIIFAAMAITTAMNRKIKAHRRWALRLFIVVAGVWFFRVARGLWFFLNDGSSPGVNNTLTGPFDMTLNFAGYLLPLMFLELYFYAQNSGNERVRLATATLIVFLTAATAIGIVNAAQMFWLPSLV